MVVDPQKPETTLSVHRRDIPAFQPFAQAAAPIELRAKARRYPGWKADGRMIGLVPASPVVSDQPVEEITLIPMGCARLRLTVFSTTK